MNQQSYSLFRCIHTSPGMAYLNRRKSQAFSYNIFYGNLVELRRACEIVENSDPAVGVKLMSEAMRSEGLQAHMEVNRLFHNFLAAAKTLIEHTRVFMSAHYSETGVKLAYEQKVQAEMADDELARFIQDLRNYMLHKGLPNSSMSLMITRGPEVDMHDLATTVSLDRDRLAEWNKWSRRGREYLESRGKEIKISALAEQYGLKVSSFYSWFDKRLRRHHRADLKELHRLQVAYSQANGEGR